jgi:hypothetical protein
LFWDKGRITGEDLMEFFKKGFDDFKIFLEDFFIRYISFSVGLLPEN